MLRKRVYLIVIVMIILMGTGCFKSKYLNQINLELPDEMEYLSNFSCGERKEVYVVGTDSQKELKIWSKEDGQEWKEVINLYELIHYDKEKEFCQVFWGKQGEIFCERVSLNSTSPIAEIYFYEIIDTNITRTWSLELECFEDGDINVIDEVYQISDDILVERELGGKCYIHNINSNKIEHVYIEENDCLAIGVVSGEIVEIDNSGVYTFDYKSKIKRKDDEVFKQIKSELCKGKNGNLYAVDDDKFYIRIDNEIYKIEEKKCQKIFEGENSYISKENIFVNKMLIDDDEIYVYVSDISDGEESIKIFSYSNKKDNKEVLKVYSLTETRILDKAVEKYMEKNPNVTVEVEIGLQKDDTNSVKKIAETLYNDMLRGDGPDVIILDGFPEEFYYYDDVLKNLNDNNKFTTRSDLFTNLVNTYQKDDKIYAVPTRFVLLCAEGNNTVLEKLSDNKFLIDSQNNRIISSEATFGAEVVMNDLADILYDVCSTNFLKSKEIDAKELELYFETMYDIYNRSSCTTIGTVKQDEKGYFTANYFGFNDSQANITMDYITWPGYDLPLFERSLETKKYGYSLFYSNQGIYIPNISIGINKESDNMQLAEGFFEFLLSNEMQARDTSDGMPINKYAFEESLILSEELQEEWNTVGLSENEKNEVKQIVELLNTPVDCNIDIKDIVQSRLYEYLEEKTTLDEAVHLTIKDITEYNSGE